MTPSLGSEASPRGGQRQKAWVLHGHAELSSVISSKSKSLSSSIITTISLRLKEHLGPPTPCSQASCWGQLPTQWPCGCGRPLYPSCSSSGFSNMSAQPKPQGAIRQHSMSGSLSSSGRAVPLATALKVSLKFKNIWSSGPRWQKKKALVWQAAS